MSDSMNAIIRSGFGKQPAAKRTDTAPDEEKKSLDELPATELASKVEGMASDLVEAVSVLAGKVEELDPPSSSAEAKPGEPKA